MFTRIHKDIKPLIDKIVHKIKLTKVIEEYEKTTYIDFTGFDININKSKYNNNRDLSLNAPTKKYIDPLPKYDNDEYRIIEHVTVSTYRNRYGRLDFFVNLSNHDCLEYINDLLPKGISMDISLVRVDKNHVFLNMFNYRDCSYEFTICDTIESFLDYCFKSIYMSQEVCHKHIDTLCILLPKRYYFSNGRKTCKCTGYLPYMWE